MARPTGWQFKVHIGGPRYRYFVTLDDATAFCNRVFRETTRNGFGGIVLGIFARQKGDR